MVTGIVCVWWDGLVGNAAVSVWVVRLLATPEIDLILYGAFGVCLSCVVGDVSQHLVNYDGSRFFVGSRLFL